MANSKLLQLKVDPFLKKDLDEIAQYKGITVAGLIKLNLTDYVRKEKQKMFTENGLTGEQELEILQREADTIALYKQGQLKPKTGEDLLTELDA